MKKILNLVLGVFLIICLILPIISLFSDFDTHVKFEESQEKAYSYDTYDYDAIVLNKTADNLVIAANELLLNEDIKADDIFISIKKSDNNSIYISKINIYISEAQKYRAEDIIRIIESNMLKKPVIILNEQK